MCTRAKYRSGFTLIELLVTISVIGLLIALVLPAIGAARESSARLQCANNLRQIGLGVASYQGHHNVFPFINNGSGFNVGEVVRISSFSAFCGMLPYLEENTLFSAINFSRPSLPGGVNPTDANFTVAKTSLSILLCPSDSSHATVWGGTNYRTNMGTLITRSGSVTVPIQGIDGAFNLRSETLNPGDFKDGLSNTAGFSEKLRGSASKRFEPRRGYWINSKALYTTADELLGVCSLATGQPSSFQADVGNIWMLPYFRFTYYNHISNPNSTIPDCVGGWNDADPAQSDGHFAARSLHRSGVNTLFMDGHVALTSNSTNLNIWRAIGTRNGGEVTSLSQ